MKAQGVPVVVHVSAKGFGGKVDGLLGMSFLSRFELKIDRRSVRIRTRT